MLDSEQSRAGGVQAYWQRHVRPVELGADGWRPDEGEIFSPAARSVRVRMYYEGARCGRPNERPFALHRTGAVGTQHYGWLWSGDVQSDWNSLRTQVAVGLNTGMSGIPLWGPDILVAPVLTPGATVRDVLLPAGRWYDFWTEESHDGPTTVSRRVDLKTLPIYVRSGALLTLGPVMQHTGQRPWNPLELRVYPGADGVATLYEDDGHSFDYTRGGFRSTTFRWSDGDQKLQIGPTASAGETTWIPGSVTTDVRVVGGCRRQFIYHGRPLEVVLSESSE